MTREEIEAALVEELSRIAPEIDFADADPDTDLREAFEIDSMDFLNLVAALHKRLGISTPEADYPRLATLRSSTDYLAERLA